MEDNRIQNQIAIYMTNKKLCEFTDKLKPAPIEYYAHMHAQGEEQADGIRAYSCIGVVLQDYSNGTGDKTVRVTANLSPGFFPFVLSRMQNDLDRFDFTEDKSKRALIGEMVAENQLFFSVACTMNDAACVAAMRWFRDQVFFSRDYSDIPRQLIEYSEDKNMLRAISDYAKAADLGILDMQFEFNSNEIQDDESLPDNIPEGIKAALVQFMHTLAETSNNGEVHLKMGEVSAKASHQGENRDGRKATYSLELSDESDGTRKLMALAPAIESALRTGGILLVDELERELHPMLVNYIIAKFQSKATNPNGAQIVFTTHNTELMNLELLRKDQLYFVDKRDKDGASELYTISEFSTRTTENIRKGYLVGKYGATPDIEIEEVE